MLQDAIGRYGQLVDILNQISDVEFQVVRQGTYPASFVPTDLLEEWYILLNTSIKHIQMLDDEVVAVILDFDMLVEQVIELLPPHPNNKESFIRTDQIWQETREMADWTVARLAYLMMPNTVEYHHN